MALGAPDFPIKTNDTGPALVTTLRDGAKDPVNLTGATVNFYMTKRGETTPSVTGEADIAADATSGVVTYEWVEGDTDEAGHYLAEFKVLFAGGERQTFPNGGYVHVHIQSDLADDISA